MRVCIVKKLERANARLFENQIRLLYSEVTKKTIHFLNWSLAQFSRSLECRKSELSLFLFENTSDIIVKLVHTPLFTIYLFVYLLLLFFFILRIIMFTEGTLYLQSLKFVLKVFNMYAVIELYIMLYELRIIKMIDNKNNIVKQNSFYDKNEIGSWFYFDIC